LNKEPFVGGAAEIIDVIILQKGIRNADAGFLLLFSADPFPGADLELNWVREETFGNVYSWNGREGWLCPALLRYFPVAPPRIYGKAKELPPRV
jgi:hypothetical protein